LSNSINIVVKICIYDFFSFLRISFALFVYRF